MRLRHHNYITQKHTVPNHPTFVQFFILSVGNFDFIRNTSYSKISLLARYSLQQLRWCKNMFLPTVNIILLAIIAALTVKIISQNKSSKNTKPANHVSPDDLIWKSIISLTDPTALHSDWHTCFNQLQTDICEALEADELFLLDNSPRTGTPLLPITKENTNAYIHNWILSMPEWMNRLEKGEQIHGLSKRFALKEEAILEQEGIQTILLIPLLVNKKLIALIGACRHDDTTLFSQRQIGSLQFITNILTMAISNQRDRSERDRLVTVVEQSSDCIIITSTSGKILYANRACEEVTGFSPEEITGKSVKSLYPPSLRTTLWKQIKEALKRGDGWSGQFTSHRKNGTLYKEKMQISPVYNQDGSIANQVLIKRDVTEEKRLESIAEAANLMENIGFVFSSIRHELGNPINSIKVSLSVLSSNLNTYDKHDIKRFVIRGLSDIGRVEYLLKTLKNFSVFGQPDIKKTDMLALLHKFTQLTEKDLAAQYIMLAINFPNEPLTGMLDPRAFLQVLLNLITNAVAALEGTENKTITISLTQNQNRQITFTVEDNGSGMEEDTVRNLFRPFFTTKEEGTGLGLVIVRKMLSKMNCSISATSQKGKGTCMEIIIPAA